GGSWTLNNSLPSGGMQNLAGYVNGSSVVLYGSQFTKVASLVDSAGYNASNNGTIADVPGVTAASNYNFKGISVVPAVPEPSSLVLVLISICGMAFGRSKK